MTSDLYSRQRSAGLAAAEEVAIRRIGTRGSTTVREIVAAFLGEAIETSWCLEHLSPAGHGPRPVCAFVHWLGIDVGTVEMDVAGDDCRLVPARVVIAEDRR